MQKGFTLIIVIALIAAFSIIAGYVYYSHEEIALAIPFLPANNTDNWKSYINSTSDYEIKYPSDWSYYESENTTSFGKSRGIEDLRDLIETKSNQTSSYQLTTITVSPAQYSTEELNREGEVNFFSEGTQYTKMTFMGVPARKQFTTSTDLPMMGGQVIIIFNYKNKGWTIHYQNNNFQGNAGVLTNRFLSTFKFTD